MSTRERIPWVVVWLVTISFCIMVMYPLVTPRYDEYLAPDGAEAGMHRNASGQVICAHLNTSTGSDHLNSTTVNVFYHNNSSFVSLGTATHQNQSAGIYCYTLTADATNYDLVKILWQGTGAITLLQTYPTTGYNDNATILDVNVTKINGTTQTAGDAIALINTVNAHLDGTLAAGTHTAQTGDSYQYLTDHLNGTIAAGEHQNSTALVDAIDTQLSATHGNGSWDATATGDPAPTVEEIDAELSEQHGPGPWTK